MICGRKEVSLSNLSKEPCAKFNKCLIRYFEAWAPANGKEPNSI